jgi:hypothetical protein
LFWNTAKSTGVSKKRIYNSLHLFFNGIKQLTCEPHNFFKEIDPVMRSLLLLHRMSYPTNRLLNFGSLTSNCSVNKIFKAFSPSAIFSCLLSGDSRSASNFNFVLTEVFLFWFYNKLHLKCNLIKKRQNKTKIMKVGLFRKEYRTNKKVHVINSRDIISIKARRKCGNSAKRVLRMGIALRYWDA